MARILFISDYAPTESNSGGVVMAEQLMYLSKFKEIDILVFSSELREYEALKTDTGKLLQRPKFGERQPNLKIGIVKKLFESVFNSTILKYWLITERRKVRKILENGSYSEVMLTVQGLYLAKLFSGIQFPKNSVILQYWDPEIWWAEQHNFTARSTKEITLMHQSMEKSDYLRHILVPSEGMASVIQNRSNLPLDKITVYYPSENFPSPPTKPPDSFMKIRNQFSKILVIAGSIYAFPEIRMILDALDEMNNSISGEEIQLIFIGPEKGAEGFEALNQLSRDKNFVHLLGRFSPPEVDACLKLSDINVLPYPFWHKDLVQQSFPSKFSKYIGSESSMLILAPTYSSLSRLLAKYGVHEGHVTTLSKTNVAREIKELLNNPNYAQLQRLKLSELRNNAFSNEKYKDALYNVFTLSEPYLEKQNLIRIPLPVNGTWVNRVNTSIRNLSVIFENIGRPRYLLRSYLDNSRLKLKIVLVIRRITGDTFYYKYVFGIRSRMNPRYVYFVFRKTTVKFLICLIGQEAYFKYITSRPWKKG